MSKYVRLFYPNTTTTTSFESSFIDFGNKYVYRKYYQDNGLVNLTFGAEIISTDEFTPTISKIQISNDSEFSSYKELDLTIVSQGSSIWFEYVVDTNAGTVELDAPGWGVVGGPQPNKTELQLTVAEIAESANVSSRLFYVRGWPLASVEGEKTVYIRFVLSNDEIYPEISNIYSKGFYSSIIWQKSEPSTPGKATAINSTDNNYVGDNIFWMFDKSQDLISELESYSINLRRYNNESYSEPFESWNNIISAINYLSIADATDIESAGNMVMMYRYEGAGMNSLAEIISPFTGVDIYSVDSGSGNWEGIELTSHTGTTGKSISSKFKFQFTSTDTIATYDPIAPPTKDQQYFAVIKNFRDVFSSSYSGGSLFLDSEVLSDHGSGSLGFATEIIANPVLAFNHNQGALYFDVSVAMSDSYYNTALFVNPNNIATNIFSMDSNVLSLFSKSYAMISISEQGIIRISKDNWLGAPPFYFEKIYTLDEIPQSGTLEVIYEDMVDLYNIENSENSFYISDTGSSDKKFITQTFKTSITLSNISNIKLRLKNIGSLGDTNDVISATIVEANEQGIPINSTYEPNLYFWNNIDTATGIIFNNTILTSNNQEFEIALTTTSSNLNLYPGKNYLLIIAITSNSGGYTKLSTKISSTNNANNFKRYLYIADYIDTNFANSSWANGGMKIVQATNSLIQHQEKAIAFDLNDGASDIYSSYKINECGQISVFITKDGESSSKLLATTEIPKLLGSYRSIAFGHRHRMVSNPTTTDIDYIFINNSKVISNIISQIPSDIESDEIVTGNYIYNGVPEIFGNSDWKNYTSATQSEFASEDNIISATNQYEDIIFTNGSQITKSQVVFDSSLFGSTNNNPDGGGQPDWTEPTVAGWVGKDLFLSKPLMDDSVKIQSEFYFNNIKDYSENEIYFLISSQELYTNSPDLYRNYVEGIGVPEDYIRVSITKDGNLNIYKNNNYEEKIVKVLYDIKSEIIKSANNINIKNINIDNLSNINGTIYILLDNNKLENNTNISISFLVIINSEEHIIEVLNEYLDSKFIPSTSMGFYLSIGSRIRYNERDDSYLSISDLQIKSSNNSVISINNEKNLSLYEEMNGLSLLDRENIYPDISLTSNNGIYYDNTAHKYIKGGNNTNSKYYLLSSSDNYSLGYNEINWCDQVIQNPNNVKCWGLVISNVADDRRALGDPQRNVGASISSGLTGRDSLPPLGDRRNYSGSSAIARSHAESDKRTLNLFVNARSYSQNKYVCSEWQWYEAMSPWSAETDWFGDKVTDLPSNLRANRPSKVDKLIDTNYTLSFKYDFNSYANKDEFDIYFGISNFKPAYRAYNYPGIDTSLSIKAINITDGGSGYISAPSVIFTPAPETGGTVAQGIAILEGGIVKQVTITEEGSGYGENTEVIFTGGTFSSSTGRSATGKVVIGPISGSSSEQIKYTVAANNGKWDYAIHDFPGAVSGNMAHNFYDPNLVSTSFVYGEDFSYSNSAEIAGIRGLAGQHCHLDRTAASYHIMLPFERQNSTTINDSIVKPIDISNRSFMYLSISNNGTVKVTNISGQELWNSGVPSNKTVEDLSIDINTSGILQIEVKRGTFQVDNAIDAETGKLVSNYTPELPIDMITIYYNEKSDRNIIAKVFTKSMDNNYFNYIYPFIGIREKVNSGISENMIGNVKILPVDSFGVVPVQPNEVSYWRKKLGQYDDNDLIYGRYIVSSQDYDDSYKYSLTSEYPHIAQSFMISENNESFPEESYIIPWLSIVDISCISIKIESNGNSSQWRCLIVPDNSDAPSIGSGTSIDINTKYSENYNRPTTDINIYDNDILGIGYAQQGPNSNILNFIFTPHIVLTTETKYWIVLTHPDISSSNNSYSSSDFSNVYVWSSATGTLEFRSIKAGATVNDAAPEIVPSQKSMVWNVNSYSWESKEYNLWYKIYKKYYINSNNTIDNEQYSINTAGISKSNKLSNYSEESNILKVDITAPWNPILYGSYPLISGSSQNDNIKKYDIIINAKDILNGNGSGIWRFRVVYYDDNNIQRYNSWVNWIDINNDNSMTYSWTYPGNYISEKSIYIQIQDKIGNISESNNITIESEYGFIVDTISPYFSRVRIEGDATKEEDLISIINRQNANVSIYALDASSAVKDFRINVDYQENSDGSLIYSSYLPMSPHFVQDLGTSDGAKFINVQFRDYANNADQPVITQTLIDAISEDGELPLAHQEYSFAGKSYLYMTTLANINRTSLLGYNIAIEGYDPYTVYKLKDSNNINQSLNSNENISVYVNSILQFTYTGGVGFYSGTHFGYANTSLGYIIFTSSLSSTDIVTIDTTESVAKLYRFDGNIIELIHKFTSEKQNICNCMEVYNESLYLGFKSGKIYSYNGMKIEEQYTLKDNGGNELPVGFMKTFKFNDETREYLYVGSRDTSMLWQYGGNRNITAYSWQEVTNLNSYSKTINGTPIAFIGQTDVYSIEGYEDTLFIGTAPNSAIFTYRRHLNDLGAIIEDIDVNLLSDISNDYSGDIVTSLKTFNNKIYAGTDKASLFYYQKNYVSQPSNSDWSDTCMFNDQFLLDTYPFSFYETPGRTNPDLSSNISIINNYNNSSSILSSEMSIKGDISEIVSFINNNTNSVWYNSISNSAGWVLEFETKIINIESEDYGKQGINVFDGTYQFSINIDKNNIYLDNNIDKFIISNNSILGNQLITSYSWQNNFTDNSAISNTNDNKDDKIRIFGMNYSIEKDLLRLEVNNSSANSYPYLEVAYLEDIFVNANSYFEIKVKAKDFQYDSTQLYIQWSDKNTGPYIKEKTYTLSIYNNNIWSDFSFNPGWTGQIKSFRILVDNTENAKLDIDYIKIKTSTESVFNSYDMNKYRLSVKGTNVKLYINDNNTPIFNESNWLSVETSEKSIIFGKIKQEELISDFHWKSIKIYSGDNLSPLEEQPINWNLLNRFSSGKAIQSLQIVRNDLVAIVNPSDKVLITDSGPEYSPKTYIMKNGTITWQDDSTYDVKYQNILYSSVWNNTLYTTSHLVDRATMDVDSYNAISFMAKKAIGYLPQLGDLLARRNTHAWDSIIKDTLPPETNILINENEYSNGINIYELNVYVKDLESQNNSESNI